jgi:hypothetical protein
MPAIEIESLPLPGVSRLRNLVPLWCGKDGCPLLCDVERGTVVAVPLEFQLHLAAALETGDPEEELLGWLMTADLLTTEGGEWASSGQRRWGAVDVGPRVPAAAIRIPAAMILRTFEEIGRPEAVEDPWRSAGIG